MSRSETERWLSSSRRAHARSFASWWGLLSLVAAVVSCSQRDAEPTLPTMAEQADFGNYYAVVIGNDNYHQAPWQTLRTAREDASAVAHLLREEYGFQVEPLLLDASRNDVFSALERMRGQLTERDNLLIYYAGHGYVDQDTDDGFWIPVEKEGTGRASWISVRDIVSFTKAMRALHVLVVADTCFGGVLLRGAPQAHDLQQLSHLSRLTQKRARLAFTSGGLEPVLDGGSDGHSAFATRLLSVLRENQGVIDSAKLWIAVREKVLYDSGQAPLWGPIRDAGHDDGEFLFVRRLERRVHNQPISPSESSLERSPANTSSPGNGGRDVVAGAARAKEACDLGDPGGCLYLGVFYENGTGVTKDAKLASEMFRRACEGGRSLGCVYLGQSYEHGTGVENNLQRATDLYKQACDDGVASACTNLGAMYGEGRGVDKDEVLAVALLKQACDKGDALGCTNLGNRYAQGRGVGIDEKRAIELFQQACRGGEPHGCTSLGTAYENGHGVRKDAARGAAFYEQACEAGDALGCSNLGTMYAEGSGVDKDAMRASDLFKEACDADEPLGCTNLGVAYEKGRGVGIDEARAAALYQKACDLNETHGCVSLGRVYANGIGVRKDETRASALYVQACKQGDPYACSFVKQPLGR